MSAKRIVEIERIDVSSRNAVMHDTECLGCGAADDAPRRVTLPNTWTGLKAASLP